MLFAWIHQRARNLMLATSLACGLAAVATQPAWAGGGSHVTVGFGISNIVPAAPVYNYAPVYTPVYAAPAYATPVYAAPATTVMTYPAAPVYTAAPVYAAPVYVAPTATYLYQAAPIYPSYPSYPGVGFNFGFVYSNGGYHGGGYHGGWGGGDHGGHH